MGLGYQTRRSCTKTRSVFSNTRIHSLTLNDIIVQFGSLAIYNVESDRTEEVINHNTFIKLHPVSYKFSADRQYMLIKQLSQSVWRRSSFGSYVLLKFVNGRPQTNNLVSLKPNSVVSVTVANHSVTV